MEEIALDKLSLGGDGAGDRSRIGRRMDTARGCIALAIRDAGFTCREMIVIIAGQGTGWSDFLLAIGLVVKNHVSRCSPEVRADRSQGHVGRA